MRVKIPRHWTRKSLITAVTLRMRKLTFQRKAEVQEVSHIHRTSWCPGTWFVNAMTHKYHSMNSTYISSDYYGKFVYRNRPITCGIFSLLFLQFSKHRLEHLKQINVLKHFKYITAIEVYLKADFEQRISK
jgi:hypothetical protein